MLLYNIYLVNHRVTLGSTVLFGKPRGDSARVFHIEEDPCLPPDQTFRSPHQVAAQNNWRPHAPVGKNLCGNLCAVVTRGAHSSWIYSQSPNDYLPCLCTTVEHIVVGNEESKHPPRLLFALGQEVWQGQNGEDSARGAISHCI